MFTVVVVVVLVVVAVVSLVLPSCKRSVVHS